MEEALFRKLHTFKQVYGHCQVPYPWKDDPLLSQWVDNVRQSQALLPPSLLSALKTCGVDFTLISLWDTFYTQLHAFYQQHGHLRVPGRKREYTPLHHWIAQQRLARGVLFPLQVNLLNQLAFVWQDPVSREGLWEKRFTELLSFKREYGHTRVPSSYSQNPPLAKWVGRQREKELLLPVEQKRRLDEAGFVWSEQLIKKKHEDWLSHFEQLKAFFEQNAHFKVPSTTKYRPLRSWMDKLRQYRGRLSQQQQQLLNDLGFPWKEDLSQQSTEGWKKRVAELEEFKKRYGNTSVPGKWKENPTLAAWVVRQRAKESLLSEWQREQLNSLGFSWSDQIKKQQQQRWLSMYRELKDYKQVHGHTRVPDKEEENYRLGRWVSWQRKRKQENKLSARRKEQLDQLGFEWEVSKERENWLRWERMYLRLKRYYKKHGHCKVPENYSPDKKLAIWVGQQRQYEWRLSLERRQKLEGLHFVFKAELQNEREQLWEQMYEKLCAFKKEQGHCRVTITHPDPKLFRWVAKQRRLSNQGRLAEKREQRLNQIGFSWMEDNLKAGEDRWDFFYSELVAFREQFGHTKVPERWQQNPALALWVSHQRRKEGALSPKRKSRLDSIGFLWKKDIMEQKEGEWTGKLKQLEDFKRAYGHCRVPANWEANPSLGSWVFRQRQQFKKGKLSPYCKGQLDKIQFEWQVTKKAEN